jgi:hypothetical protein
MTVLAMTLPLGRNSPVHLSRRDIVIEAGDDLTLNLSIIADDTPAAAPVDLTGATVQMLLCRRPRHWDYGWLPVGGMLLTAAGTITDAAGGLATVVMPYQSRVFCSPDRIGYALRLTIGGARSTLAWGAVNLTLALA